MKQKLRTTQRDMVFGIFRPDPNRLNPGWMVWWNGRYIYPRNRKPVRTEKRQQALPLAEGAEEGGAHGRS